MVENALAMEKSKVQRGVSHRKRNLYICGESKGKAGDRTKYKVEVAEHSALLCVDVSPFKMLGHYLKVE